MKVSILVPIYNVEAYIERCAISLFEQTYKNIEYIFVNDCTLDNSMEILCRTMECYPERAFQTKVINHTTNKGLAAARTSALRNSTGDYIMHVDSDDYLSLDAVEKCVTLAVENNADIIACALNHIYEHKSEVEIPVVGTCKEEYIYNLLNRRTPVNLVAQFVRRDVIHEDAYPIIGLNFGEDYVTTSRVAYYADKILPLNDPVYNYWHKNIQSYTNNVSIRHIKDVLRACDIIELFYKSKKDFHLYTSAINDAFYRNIVLLLILCDNRDLDYIMSLDIKKDKPKNLRMSMKHKLMYILYYLNCKNLIKVYKRLGLFIQRNF